jgi:hypothetical protein
LLPSIILSPYDLTMVQPVECAGPCAAAALRHRIYGAAGLAYVVDGYYSPRGDRPSSLCRRLAPPGMLRATGSGAIGAGYGDRLPPGGTDHQANGCPKPAEDSRRMREPGAGAGCLFLSVRAFGRVDVGCIGVWFSFSGVGRPSLAAGSPGRLFAGSAGGALPERCPGGAAHRRSHSRAVAGFVSVLRDPRACWCS